MSAIAGNVADLFVVLDSVTEPFSRGMKKAAADAEAESSKMSGALRGVGKISLGLGAAVIGIGVASADMASKFQSTMATLSTQAGVAKSQIGSLSSGVLSLAGQVGFSPDSLASALYHIESSFASIGITGPKALSLLKVAAEGAAVGHADLVDVTNALDAAVASGIPGVQDFTQAMGVLNATVGSGDMTMQDLADAFGTGLLANVKSYGLSITDVGAALATFGDNNIRGAAAATDLRMSVQAMAVPAKAGADQLAALGMSTTQMAKDMQSGGLLKALEDLKAHMDGAKVSAKEQGQVLTTVFGKKAGAGIVVLYDQLDRLKSKYPDLAKGANGFGDAWTQTKATVSQQFNEIRAGADALGIRLGQALLPQLSKLITEGQGALGQITAGFDGKTVKGPAFHMQNAHLNQELAPVTQSTTMLERFGETLHGALTNAEAFVRKLRPIGDEFARFALDLWQGGEKIVAGLEPTAKLLGGALFLGLQATGKILADVVGPAFKWFGDFIDAHQGAVKFFAEVVLGALVTKMTILGSLNAAKGLIGLATAIVSFPLSQASEIGDAVKGVSTALNGSELKNGKREVEGLKNAFTDLKTAGSGVMEKIFPSTGGALYNMGQFQKATKDLETDAEGAGSQLPALAGGIGNVGKAAEEAEGSASTLMGTLGKLAVGAGAVGLIVGGATLIGTTLGKLTGVGDHFSMSLEQVATQLKLASESSSATGSEFTKTAVAWARLGAFGTAGTQDVDQALAQMIDSGHASDAATEFAAISTQLQQSGMSASDAAAKFPQYEQALKDAGAAAKTMDGQVSSMLGAIQQQQALTGFQSDLQNVTQSIKDNGKALTGNSAAAIANQSALAQGATDILNFYQAQRNAGVGISGATNAMNGQIAALEQTAIKAGMSKGDVEAYIATLLNIPKSEVTKIVADTTSANKSLNRLLERIDSSVGTITVSLMDGGNEIGNLRGPIGHKASGGPVEAGNTYWVGEHGPELVTFGASGYVTPTNMLKPAILAGAHGGRTSGAGGMVVYQTNVNVKVEGNVTAERKLVDVVRKEVLQYNGRNSANGLSLSR